MDPEVQKRIFEPFYTTKEIGKGSGLGLAMAQGVIEQLKGTIRCRSAIGEGTEFEVIFPTCPSPRIVAEPDSDLYATSSATLNILLVDDEELVRKTGKAMLESLGHNVVTANSGNDALSVLKNSEEFHVVFLDYAMPGTLALRFTRSLKKHIPGWWWRYAAAIPLTLSGSLKMTGWRSYRYSFRSRTGCKK